MLECTKFPYVPLNVFITNHPIRKQIICFHIIVGSSCHPDYYCLCLSYIYKIYIYISM